MVKIKTKKRWYLVGFSKKPIFKKQIAEALSAYFFGFVFVVVIN